MGNFLLLDGSWWCIMLDDGYWWCIMFEDSSGLLLSCLIMALWFSIKRWDTWFTLFLTTPNFTPQKNKTSMSIPSNMVGWLVGCFQPMNYCILKDDQSKDVEDVPFGGCLRMIFKHQNSELCKGLRLCVLVSNHTVSVWLLQSHPRYGSLLALLFSECTLQQKNLWAFRPSAEKRNIYIYKYISRTSNFKKTSEHFDTFWVNSSSPMMPMVWYWSYPQLGKAANRQWPFVPVCSPIHSDLQAYDYKWNLHTKKWKKTPTQTPESLKIDGKRSYVDANTNE